MLSKLAADETAHPQTRQNAVQMAIDATHAPWNKPYKPDFNKLVTSVPSQTLAQSTPPPSGATPAPGMSPDQTMSAQGMLAAGGQAHPSTVTLATPPSPPGINYTPEELTRIGAQRAGAVTGAEAGAAAKFPIMQIDPETGQMRQVFASGTGTQMGQTFENAFNPMAMRGMAAMIHPVNIAGPDGAPIPALQNKFTGEVYDQDMNVIPGAQVFAPSLNQRTGTEAMNAAGQVTRHTTPTPRMPTMGARRPTGQTGPASDKLQPVAPPPSANMSAGGAPTGQAGVVGAVPGSGPAVPMPTPQVAGPTTSSPKPTRAAAGPAKATAPVGSDEWIAKANPIQLDAWDWATQGRKPTGGPMAERQVRQAMAAMGLRQPAIPIPPAMQQKVQEGFVARNSAISIIDDIMKNRSVLDSLLSSGKIAIASNPDGTGVLSRAAALTDQEAKVAGDFQQLIEHANLLRGPLGATGFRGKEAWGALQAQRGRPMADPRITAQVMMGMRSRLVGLNSADKMVLGGQGMTGGLGEPRVGDHKVGDVVTVKGNKIKITAIHDDGSFDGEASK